jgi:hypothetical protein
MSDPVRPVMLVGLIRLREHCAFSWQEPERGGQRVARVTSTHCAECTAEIKALGYVLESEEAAPGE